MAVVVVVGATAFVNSVTKFVEQSKQGAHIYTKNSRPFIHFLSNFLASSPELQLGKRFSLAKGSEK